MPLILTARPLLENRFLPNRQGNYVDRYVLTDLSRRHERQSDELVDHPNIINTKSAKRSAFNEKIPIMPILRNSFLLFQQAGPAILVVPAAIQGPL
jgi:hypothetical protein